MNGEAPAVDLETYHAISRFLYRQAEILDDRDWDAWLDLFTADGRYWAPVTRDQEEAEGVPNVFYEDRNLMRVRIKRMSHPRAHSQHPPDRTVRVISNIVVKEFDAATGDVVVDSKFHATEYRRESLRHLVGRYRHWLIRADDGYRIRLQRVDLIDADGPYEYVLQSWL